MADSAFLPTTVWGLAYSKVAPVGLVLYVVIGALVGLLWFGLIGGFAAAITGGGREHKSVLKNTGIGLLGSLIGGTLWAVFEDQEFRLSFGGLVASLVGAVLLLLLLNAAQRRRGQSPPQA